MAASVTRKKIASKIRVIIKYITIFFQVIHTLTFHKADLYIMQCNNEKHFTGGNGREVSLICSYMSVQGQFRREWKLFLQATMMFSQDTFVEASPSHDVEIFRRFSNMFDIRKPAENFVVGKYFHVLMESRKGRSATSSRVFLVEVGFDVRVFLGEKIQTT